MAGAVGAHGLFADEFAKLWSMGVSGERSLGRPCEWDGGETGFDDFSYKFANWLGGLPGQCDVLLDHAAAHARPITQTTTDLDQQTMARGVATSLKSLVGGTALDIVKASVGVSWDIVGQTGGEKLQSASALSPCRIRLAMDDPVRQLLLCHRCRAMRHYGRRDACHYRAQDATY